MNTSLIGIGLAIGLVIGSGGLYFVLSEQILSTDVLPSVKKLQDEIESKQEKVNSLTKENDEIMKFSTQLQEENKKLESELKDIKET
ncbi:MAG: hypothetical protein ACT4N1_01775, partial [Nitrososphaerota archaeon]